MHIQDFGVKKRLIKYRLRFACLLLICLSVAASSCALSEQRAHPEIEVKINRVTRPVLLPPDVGLLELLPSGLIRQRDDWSATGCHNLQIAISNNLEKNNIRLKPLIVDPSIAQELAEVQSLYRLVHKSMRQQTFKTRESSQANRRFEYSVGSINTLMGKLGADAMIFVSGYDRVSRAGRKALIDLAIADAAGTILYYSVKGSIQGSDLRDPASADRMVRELLAGFSRIKR